MNKPPLSAFEIEALTFIYDVPAAPAAKKGRWTTGARSGTAGLTLAWIALAARAWIGERTGGA